VTYDEISFGKVLNHLASLLKKADILSGDIGLGNYSDTYIKQMYSISPTQPNHVWDHVKSDLC
jgi:hypothetical protein